MTDDTSKKDIDEANKLAQIVTEAEIGIDILKKMEQQAKELLNVLDTPSHGVEQTKVDATDTQTAVAAAQEFAAAQVAEMAVDPSLSARSEMTAKKSETVTVMPDSLMANASADNDTASTVDTTDPIASLVSNGN